MVQRRKLLAGAWPAVGTVGLVAVGVDGQGRGAVVYHEQPADATATARTTLGVLDARLTICMFTAELDQRSEL